MKIYKINTESSVIIKAKNEKSAIDKFNSPQHSETIYKQLEENLELIDIINIKEPTPKQQDTAIN